MDYKAQLGTLLDAMVAGKMDEAKAAFHTYVIGRTSELVNEGKKGVNPFAKKDDDEDKDDKKSDKKDKKSDKDDEDKDDKKSDKKAKKSDKDDEDKDEDGDDEGKDDKKSKKVPKGFVPFEKKK